MLLDFAKRLNTFLQNVVVVQKNRWKRFVRSFYEGQHQLTSTTSDNRYPEIFKEATGALHTSSQRLKILSFGCSTGEECFSLHQYFPTAHIIGADINTRNLGKARRRNQLPEVIKFIESNSENLTREGKYDAIFCMSVLCRWEETKDLENCGEIYPFEKFDNTINMLCDLLNVNGILVLYNSNFRFEDTAIAQNFEIVSTPLVADSGFVHKFDRSNNRIRIEHANCIFRKKV